jgi:hypothetical protein
MASGKHFKYVILGGGVAAVRARAPPFPALRLPVFRLVSVLPSPPFGGFVSSILHETDGFVRTRNSLRFCRACLLSRSFVTSDFPILFLFHLNGL